MANTNQSSSCNHLSDERSMGFSRRALMRAGVATMLGMTLRDLVTLAGTTGSTSGGTSGRATADHVILIYLNGGASHIDTFDPKPGRPVAGEFKPIKTSASGIEISEILPRIAEQMKHAALIRSLVGTEGAHERGMYHLLTNYHIMPQMVNPTMGAIAAHELAPIGDLPSFVSIGGRALSAGYLGHACEAYYVGAPGQPDPYLHVPAGITAQRAQRRLDALAQLNDGFRGSSPDPQYQATTESYQTALSFMKSPALSAFDLSREKPEVRQAYGDNNFGNGCLLARRLVEKGVRFVQVNVPGFDTHFNNFPALRKLGATIDPAIAALISDLASSGLLRRTLVLTLSEFGRTPRINEGGGRDHHPGVFSSLLAGGGIKPGTLIGASDADGRVAAQRPVTPGDLHATVCQALGIEPSKTVDTPLGRPMRLVDEGKAVGELLGA